MTSRSRSIRKRAHYLLPFVTAGALAFGCQGPFDDDSIAPDDFFGDVGSGVGVGVTVGSGSFPTGPCAGGAVDVHASISLNEMALRTDATENGGAVGQPIDVEGVLGAVTDTGFEVDTCALVACTEPAVYEVEIDAGLAGILMPEGAFVRLTYSATAAGEFAVVVTNLPVLEGQTNPISTGQHAWLEAMRGFVDDAPFTASFTLTDRCWQETGPSARSMVVRAAGNPGEALEVVMGSTSPWTIGVGPNSGLYDVTNLSSYTEGEKAIASLLVVRR